MRKPHTSASDTMPAGFRLRQKLLDKSEINKVAWSPDGKSLATSAQAGISLWNTETAQLIRRLDWNLSLSSCVVWSRDGQMLAAGYSDGTIRLWDVTFGKCIRTLIEHSGSVNDITLSPDGLLLASASDDKTVRLWDIETGKVRRKLLGHDGGVHGLIWLSKEQLLVSASATDSTIRLWELETGSVRHVMEGHHQAVNESRSALSLAWSPKGRTLASAGGDNAIRIYDIDTGKVLSILEGHTDRIGGISFSANGRLLASKSSDHTVRLLRCDSWEPVAVLEEHCIDSRFLGDLKFHPNALRLATLGEKNLAVRIWDLTLSTLLKVAPPSQSLYYSNAKVVLVGDTGVGKTGLSLVLTGQKWSETGSTHGRHVWTFDTREIVRKDGQTESCETLLWDLAGQPDYRLIHQLHLTEVAVALVVFDARSETDPFSGVRHWQRALRQAQRVQGDAAPPVIKFLVSARADVGRINVSPERMELIRQQMGFDRYFETSAKEGWSISELAEEIRRVIDWDTLPTVRSTELFQTIKAFLVKEKEANRLLSTVEDLYRAFLNSENAPAETDDLRAQFETGIGRVESRGLIQRLSFGKLVLLQPELRDAYASAMVNAARDSPKGLGGLSE